MNVEGIMKKHTPTLPLDLIREILLRLPVKSVLRLKCVCKSWLSLISDPQFGISHYALAAAPSHRLLLIENDLYAESIDIETPLPISAVHFVLPRTSPSYCYQYDHAEYGGKYRILGSCRGIILLYCDRSSLVLWNPSIGVQKLLPNFDHGGVITREFLYGFGYDTSSNDYLLILIGMFNDYVSDDDDDHGFENVDEGTVCYHVFSFKTGSSVRSGVFVSYKNLGNGFRAGSLFNEALHWLVFSGDKRVPVILAFDLLRRRFSEIPLFDHFTMEKYEVYSLRVMGGCLSVCCSVRGCATDEIWVMKEYRVKSSWTKSIVIPTDSFSPICITKDGGIIGSNISESGRLEKLNEKGELLEHFIYGGGQWLYSANVQSAMYRESLLPLSSVIQETSEDDQQ